MTASQEVSLPSPEKKILPKAQVLRAFNISKEVQVKDLLLRSPFLDPTMGPDLTEWGKKGYHPVPATPGTSNQQHNYPLPRLYLGLGVWAKEPHITNSNHPTGIETLTGSSLISLRSFCYIEILTLLKTTQVYDYMCIYW